MCKPNISATNPVNVCRPQLACTVGCDGGRLRVCSACCCACSGCCVARVRLSGRALPALCGLMSFGSGGNPAWTGKQASAVNECAAGAPQELCVLACRALTLTLRAPLGPFRPKRSRRGGLCFDVEAAG